VDVHTPINVFRRDDEYIFVLTYGSDADWGKNVLAADGCWIRTRGHDVRLTQPEVIFDPTRRLVPAPIRFIERFGNVTEFVRMRLRSRSRPSSSRGLMRRVHVHQSVTANPGRSVVR